MERNIEPLQSSKLRFYRFLVKKSLRGLSKGGRRHMLGWPPFAVFVGDLIGNQISYQGWFEDKYIRFLEHYVFPKINPSLIALDIGANIGNHSNRFANYFSKVHAFEPNKRVYYLLKANAMLTIPPQKIVSHNVGCSDKNFRQKINYSLENFGGASIEGDRRINSKSTSYHTATFELVCLDDYLPKEDQSRIGFIKLDVEFHETAAMKGAEKIIAFNKPIIAFEAHNIDKPREFLGSLGYDNYYGFEKRRDKWFLKSVSRLVEVTEENKVNIDRNLVIASNVKLDEIIGLLL